MRRKKESERESGGEEEGKGAIWKASKVICTRGEFKMIMDNSKVWPHEGAKIVHSQYFTAAARLTGARGLGNTSKSTRGEQCHLERKRENEAQRDSEIKREEGRIALCRSLILYIVPEKTRHTRERGTYPHMQL